MYKRCKPLCHFHHYCPGYKDATMNASRILFEHVSTHHPEVYDSILRMIKPHTLKPILNIFQEHLEHSVTDLDVFNKHYENIPSFCFEFIKAIIKHFPQPGDAYGIQLTCRITRSDTQGTLDSKHLRSTLNDGRTTFNVDKSLLYELTLFSSQSQVFELAMRHQYSTVFLEGYTLKELFERIPQSCYLDVGGDYNKAVDEKGREGYVNTFAFIIVKYKNGFKVLYQSARDLLVLMKRLDDRKIVAFTDIRYLIQKCGIVCHFFNMIQILEIQLFTSENSVHEKDVKTVVKYLGKLPTTREGLANNEGRSPMDVLSFEAPKKNLARYCTGPKRGKKHKIKTSADKVFWGMQFNEGTGSNFGILAKRQKMWNQKRLLRNNPHHIQRKK